MKYTFLCKDKEELLAVVKVLKLKHRGKSFIPSCSNYKSGMIYITCDDKGIYSNWNYNNTDTYSLECISSINKDSYAMMGAHVLDGTFKPKWNKTVSYCRGDEFICINGDRFVLVSTDEKTVCLVSKVNWNRWNKPIRVGDPNNITKEEFEAICGGEPYIFKADK